MIKIPIKVGEEVRGFVNLKQSEMEMFAKDLIIFTMSGTKNVIKNKIETAEFSLVSKASQKMSFEENRFELGIKLVKENRLNKAIVQKAIRKAEEKYSIQIKEGEYVQGTEITLLELLQEMGLKDKPDMKDWNNPRCRTKILNTPSKRLEE